MMLQQQKRSRSQDLRSQPGFRLIAYMCLAFLFGPIFVLILFSFNGGDVVTYWEGFSDRWYSVAFNNPAFHAAAANTITVAGSSTLLSTILATLAALGTSGDRAWRGQTTAFTMINLPLMVPEIVKGAAMLSFFATLASVHLRFGIGNLIIAHTLMCLPFAYMPIRARLKDMDQTLQEAAADLYASPLWTFWYVTLPLLGPGIAGGAALAFTVSFDDFTVTQLVAGPGQTTLPLFIWAQNRQVLSPELNAMCSLLLGASVLFIVVAFIATRKRA